MKISLGQNDIAAFDRLVFNKETNIGMASLQDYMMGDGFDSLYPVRLSESDPEAEYQSLMLEASGIAEEDGFDAIKGQWEAFRLSRLETDDYTNNPYFQKIGEVSKTIGGMSAFMDHYEPYEPFLYDEVKISQDGSYREIQPMGFFEKRFDFLSLSDGDKVWMSLCPHEINTMKTPLGEMRGNVLVMGLGIGYFPYMLSLGKSVKSITVIEKDPNVIALFQKCIAPRLDNPEIKVIQADAYQVLKGRFIEENHIDSCFVDLWHSPIDGIIHYLKCRGLESGHGQVKFSYWIEKSLLAYLRRYAISLIQEELDGFTDKDYLYPKGDDDRIVAYLHDTLKERTIRSYRDIVLLLTDESLAGIAKMGYGKDEHATKNCH